MNTPLTPSESLELQLADFLAAHVFSDREDGDEVADTLAEIISQLIEAKIEEQTGAVE